MLRLFRGCLTFIGLLVVVAVGFSVYRTLTRPAAPLLAPPASTPAAPAANLDARLAEAETGIRQAAAAGQHKAVTFTVTDAELTARVNEAIAQGQVQVPVTNVKVNSAPGQVNITGQAKVIVAVPFTMTAVPRVSGGKAQLQVTGVDFGGVPVPGALAAQLTSAVGTDNLLGDLPLTVTTFRAEQGRLVLEGTT